MQLSAFFAAPDVVRDAWVRFGLPPGAQRGESVCYATSLEALAKANANENLAAIITTAELAGKVAAGKGCVISPWPQLAFYVLHNALCRGGESQWRSETSIDASASIDPSARLGRHVSIGANVRISAYAVLEDFTSVGAGSWIGPHAVIGGRGLQDTLVNGHNVIVECAGGVQIGERCEILSGALIQRPYLCERTEIGDDTKLGPGASVGHNCLVGRRTILGARALIAGNCQVGDDVWIGAGAIISDAICIGNGARVQLGSVVVHKVPAAEVVSGNFALPHAKHLRFHTRQRYEQ